ncbi:hypothetical protein BCR42DRAFT_183079 [Absidia repens]|uniref:Uncharacterized protein n=1 Tax=Absidia repens TaxID=90262 RepID=A0A1X2HY24_9FUNG|nr:hypothetical protein BCR42DRAFT_183079 [Absidia repens]
MLSSSTVSNGHFQTAPRNTAYHCRNWMYVGENRHSKQLQQSFSLCPQRQSKPLHQPQHNHHHYLQYQSQIK